MWVAFLRGINVGGHHKVPMAELKKLMESLGCSQVSTILNSGNVIFNFPAKTEATLEKLLEKEFAAFFGFAIPVLVRSGKEILDLMKTDPFKAVEVNANIRLYVTFLKTKIKDEVSIADIEMKEGFKILSITKDEVISVLDLATTQTVKGMEILQNNLGNDITTRNWNTILKCSAALLKK